MRPIIWGIILTIVSALIRVKLQSDHYVVSFLTGMEASPATNAIYRIMAVIMVFSIPIALCVEVYRWTKRRKR